MFTLLEREVLDQTLKLLRYPSYPEGDGILCPGGSTANMYGIVLARYSKIPEIKTKGLSGKPRLAIFSSDCAHYSFSKAAHWLGLGTENLYTVRLNIFIYLFFFPPYCGKFPLGNKRDFSIIDSR